MMFTSYCDASILNGHPYIGCLIKTDDNTYTNRFELSQSSMRITANFLEFLALEYLVKEIQELQLTDGIIYFDSDFVNRSLIGQSDWFKKRTKAILHSLKKHNLKFECIASKDNLAHDIARGEQEEKEALEITIPLYDLSHKAYIAYQRETKNKSCSKLIAQRKLTRNIPLSIKAKEEAGVIQYRYGNLNIYVEDNTIVRIEKGAYLKGFKKSKEEYRRLNELLYL
jgi:ribonuclease HI